MADVILVVEDDPAINLLVVRALGATYTVHAATSGKQALALLEKIPVPVLVITDLMMPDMDGIALAKALKASPALKGVPILFLTASTSSRQVVGAINAGARQVMSKPFKVPDLLKKVEQLTRKGK